MLKNEPYKPPKSDGDLSKKQETSEIGKYLALIGSLFVMALPIGLVTSIISMSLTFQEITLTGSGDAEVMSEAMASALVYTVLGIVFSLVGAITMAVSIVFFNHRKPWVYRVSLTASIFTLLLFPVGTVVAIIILIVLIRNKTNFYLGNE